MRGIKIISTSTVRAAASHDIEFSTRKIELTPWDLQLLLMDPIQKGLLFHKPNTFSQNNTQRLKTSLSRTLDFFPPLSGRLATINHHDNTTSFFINCNNAGALFVHSRADGVTVSDINDTVYPLLAVQVTELADGIFIGCTINHTVVDGTSFWHFFNSWSEISRGFDRVSKPPVLNRWFLGGTNLPIRISFPNDHNKVLFDEIMDIESQPLKERVFHFSKESIAQLKAKANAEIDSNTPISSLQAVLAYLWRSIIRCSDTHPDRESSYRLLIVQAGTVTMKAGELLERGLGFVAREMNKMVALHTEEKIRSFLESWVQEPKLLTEGNMAAEALVTNSSPRFNVTCPGSGNKSHGKITVFSGVEEGSIDIETCLLAETLEAMGNNSEFMEAVTL
ncbi:putative shikimate O-hydroxycinnamoyltransferase [Rosa chinensis]|uniref:Putative shikimate O-hydroxycinnamoyltransferase n=1 Tax=Rosa chinensis TaxID=74649 RepID=A0A2P6RNL4_ROSCH|nr:putative shikimate O-hydroxycinnamoyltransferase [Rosa chinensis]